MKKILLACTLLLTSMLQAEEAAEYNTHQLAAKDLLAAMQTEQNTQLVFEAILNEQVQQNPFLENYKAELNEYISRCVDFKAVEPELIRLYTENFTEEELLSLASFYRSDLGQVMINRLPQITGKAAYIGFQRAIEHIGCIAEMIDLDLDLDDLENCEAEGENHQKDVPSAITLEVVTTVESEEPFSSECKITIQSEGSAVTLDSELE